MKKVLVSLMTVFILFACSDSKDSDKNTITTPITKEILEQTVKNITRENLVIGNKFEISLPGMSGPDGGDVTNPRNEKVIVTSLDYYFIILQLLNYDTYLKIEDIIKHPGEHDEYKDVYLEPKESKRVPAHMMTIGTSIEKRNPYTYVAYISEKELDALNKLKEDLPISEYITTLYNFIMKHKKDIRVYSIVYYGM